MADFQAAIEKVLREEGGYVNDPNDPGGETKFGISKRQYPHVDIAALTRDQAKQIYRDDYWDVIHGEQIESQPVADVIFDFGVNAGARLAAKVAQRLVNETTDGWIGPKTLAALNGYEAERFVAEYTLARIAHYTALVVKNPSLRKFHFGWTRRALGGVA